MRGGSREAKGHKTTGGGRTWYKERETEPPVSPHLLEVLDLLDVPAWLT